MAWWDERPHFEGQAPTTPVFEAINLSPRWRARLRLKRMLAERWLDALGPPRSWRRGPRFVGLCYHGVIADDDRDSWYDPNLVTSVGFLDRQCHLLTRWFEPVVSTALIERLDQPPASSAMALVTYDDGLKSVYDLGLGVMRGYDIKATMFLNDSVLDGGSLWHDVAAGSARLLTRDTIARVLVEEGHPRGRDALSIVDDTLARRTVEALKEMESGALARAVEALRQASGYAPRSRRYMTVEEIQAVVGGGHEIGGHSTNHYILSLLDSASLIREVEGNREALEVMLGRPVSVFAYPNGDHGERERDALKEMGFAGAFEVEGDGCGGSRWALPRRNACDLMCMDERGQFSAALFFWTLLSPKRWLRRLGRAARRV